jgi:FKBP-type peptidyl-prolyl cis-trans isomerase FkpA
MMKQGTARLTRTIAAAILFGALTMTACGQQDGATADSTAVVTETETIQSSEGAAENMEVITELQITDVVTGDGATASAGQQVVVHYTGWLYDPGQPDNKGEKFDSSVDRGDPFVFPLGAGRVIRGWDEGFAGMQIGGKRILVIPPDMAYGERGAGGVIPPNATLMFEVDLLEIQ